MKVCEREKAKKRYEVYVEEEEKKGERHITEISTMRLISVHGCIGSRSTKLTRLKSTEMTTTCSFVF